MDTKYTYRRSGGPVRRPSRHKRPPWLLWIILIVIAIALIVFIVIKLVGTRSSDSSSSGGSSGSEISSTAPDLTSDPAGQIVQEPTPEPENAALPQQNNPGSAPEDMGTLMLVDGVGYEYYNFSEEATNKYISAIAALGSSLSSSATVYNIVVPTSMDILLDEAYLTQYQVNSSDQRKAIDNYIIPSINAMCPDVRTVAVFDTLRQHCDENIYFRTDRTWTQLGAYYAYVEFCKVKGAAAASLDQFERRDYEGFLGGFYTQTDDYEMSLAPDTVSAYFSSANTSLTFTDSDGYINEDWSVIADGDNYAESLLYLIFAAGDQPYKVLENSDMSDGSACIVVQESFGNFFIPFLTSNYQYVYVIDYRYYNGSVQDLVREKSASDVIVISNVISTSSSSAVDAIESVF